MWSDSAEVLSIGVSAVLALGLGVSALGLSFTSNSLVLWVLVGFAVSAPGLSAVSALLGLGVSAPGLSGVLALAAFTANLLVLRVFYGLWALPSSNLGKNIRLYV